MNTANKFQMNYALAKARLMAILARYDKLEQEYISSRQIVNRDGSVPSHIWAMDDESTFEKAANEFSALTTELEKELYIARNALWKAEGHLIAYSLSIVRTGAYGTLKAGVKRSTTIRHNLLELAFRLDASSVPPAS